MLRQAIPNPLMAAFLRGGTSKGVFINRRYLGPDPAAWDALFLRLMGSPDPRQLNGMGGGVSSLSKVVVVGPPTSAAAAAAGIDVEYTFAQVGVANAVVDYTGNCGNLASMAGVFAVDEAICAPRRHSTDPHIGTVRTWNTNTAKEVRTTFPLDPSSHRAALDLPEVAIAGVPGAASRIVLDFFDPAGARTGHLLPSGRPADTISADEGDSATLSLVDATNPTVFVSASALFGHAHLPPATAYTDSALLARLERFRAAGARAMGLDPTALAQPKIAVVGVPQPRDADVEGEGDVDVEVQALSMGVLHRAVPMTVGLCLGVAAAVEGTVVHAIVRQARARGGDAATRAQGMVRMRHPGGVVEVGAEVKQNGSVNSASVVRTGRRLMQGVVWW